jgi:hypothetical protein
MFDTNTITLIAAIIAALAAIFSAVISAIFGVLSAKRSASQKLAEMRQLWIEDLRDQLADFVGTVHRIMNQRSVESRERKNEQSIENLNSDLMRLESYISLKLNHEEAAPRRLVNVVKQVRGAAAYMSHGAMDLVSRTVVHLGEVDEVARFVFKTEWDRASDEIKPVSKKKRREREEKMREWYARIPDTCTRYERPLTS